MPTSTPTGPRATALPTAQAPGGFPRARRLALPVLFALVAIGIVTAPGTARLASAGDERAAGPMTQPDAAAALAGRTWRLVRIMSMDDTTYAPEDRSHYTLTFGAGGEVQLRADCNRGCGTWESSRPGALTFGQLATTRALCPPGSLHDRYLAGFSWVRSYVLRDGNLFLATMADGSIIEFEPVPRTPDSSQMPSEPGSGSVFPDADS